MLTHRTPAASLLCALTQKHVLLSLTTHPPSLEGDSSPLELVVATSRLRNATCSARGDHSPESRHAAFPLLWL